MDNLTCALHLCHALASCTCVSFCVALRVACCVLRCVACLRRALASCTCVSFCVALRDACCVLRCVASCGKGVDVLVAGRCVGTYLYVLLVKNTRFWEVDR